MFVPAKNSKTENTRTLFFGSKKKRKEGHFWSKEGWRSIYISKKKIFKKKNKAKRKRKAWLVILIHGFISFASSSWLDLPPLPRSFPV